MKTIIKTITFTGICLATCLFSSLRAQQKSSDWGPDSLETLDRISIYAVNLRTFGPPEAIESWRYVFFNAPCVRKSTFIDGVKIYSYFIDKTDDPDLKSQLVDTLLMIYDKRLDCFGNDCEVIGRKAIEMLNYRPEKYFESYQLLKESVESCGTHTKYFFLQPYIKTAIMALATGKIERDDLFAAYISTLDIIEAHDNDQDYLKAKDQIEKEIKKLGINCSDLVTTLKPQYESNPDDPQLWSKIYNLLKGSCSCDPLLIKVTERMNNEKIDPAKARRLAQCYSNSEDYSKSLLYYKQAYSHEIDNYDKADDCMSIARLYQHNGDFTSSRQFALEAASLLKGWGAPYLLIGDLYASSSQICFSGNDEKNRSSQKTVYWFAIDAYEAAKKADQSCSLLANEKIALYSPYMPTTVDGFWFSWKEGDEYAIECWINQKTTIRFSKVEN